MGSDLRTSVTRTVVPYVVGLAVTWLATQGVEVDETARANFTALVTFVVGTAYYLLARLVESRWPKFGWLLGKAEPPVYDTTGYEHEVEAAERRAVAAEAEAAQAREQHDELAVQLAEARRAVPAKKAPAKKAAAKKATAKKKGS